MADHLSAKQKETLTQVRNRAQQVLALCAEAEAGKISGEEFEKRVSKVSGQGGSNPGFSNF